MDSFDYSIHDLLPAFPGCDLSYIEKVQRDNANALNRPVIAYGMLGVKPCVTEHFNIGEFSIRLPPEPQKWPPQDDKTNIFVFGGSTVVGHYVADGDTIPALMQQRMDPKKYCVYNLGGGNYTSRMAFLRFLSVLDAGLRPHLAVFVNGYNDCFYALGDPPLTHVLDKLYQDEKRRRKMSVPRAAIDYLLNAGSDRRRLMPSARSYSITEADLDIDDLIVGDGILNALENAECGIPLSDIPDSQKRLAARVWRRYVDNMSMVRLLGGRHGIKTLFCWQPVPYFRTSSRQRIMEDLFLSFATGAICSPVYNWLEAKDFPEEGSKADFRDLSGIGESVDDVSYLDVCHYTPIMAAKVADHVVSFICEHL